MQSSVRAAPVAYFAPPPSPPVVQPLCQLGFVLTGQVCNPSPSPTPGLQGSITCWDTQPGNTVCDRPLLEAMGTPSGVAAAQASAAAGAALANCVNGGVNATGTGMFGQYRWDCTSNFLDYPITPTSYNYRMISVNLTPVGG